jgi:hypothetical protein
MYFCSVFVKIIIINSIQPLGRFWQEPEPSQATGMALARCILGKFLGVVCHCLPLPLDVPIFAARCLQVPINASAPSSERWKCGRECFGNFAEITPFLRHLDIFYMPQICDMGQTALPPFRRKACWGFFLPKNPTASASGVPEASMLTNRPPKPFYLWKCGFAKPSDNSYAPCILPCMLRGGLVADTIWPLCGVIETKHWFFLVQGSDICDKGYISSIDVSIVKPT